MSFLATASSGASNNFTPGGGSPLQGKDQANATYNYTAANNGFNYVAGKLQDQIEGRGPNLANQLLQNATGQNIANQAALMGGQRGAASNVGLMVRNIGQQGANIQQQAAGQSATNKLAQQISAQQQLQGVYSSQGQLANSMYGNVQNGINANNEIGSRQAQQNAQMNQGLIGGLAGAGAGMISGMGSSGSKPSGGTSAGGMDPSMAMMFAAKGGEVPGIAQSSPNFSQNFLMGGLSSAQPRMFAKGGSSLPMSPVDYRRGGEVKAQIPQQRAVVPGNSYKNDKIPAMVSEDEVVLPREVTKSPNAPEMAAHFMAQVMAGKHRVKR